VSQPWLNMPYFNTINDCTATLDFLASLRYYA
jgi:hypothetical protein